MPIAWLNNSRIIAIFAVVLLHVAANVVLHSPFGSQGWWAGNLYDSLTRWCVPVFVMISGALLLDPGKNESLTAFYQKRMSKVLVPLVFWSVFYLLWSLVRAHVKGESASLAHIFQNNLLTGSPYYHMWFMYMIVFLYLFTPFLRKVVSASSRTELAVLTGIGFAVAALNAAASEFGMSGSSLFSNLFLPFIPYFFLGYLIRTNESSYSASGLWGLFLLTVFLTAAGFYFFAGDGGFYYIYNYLSLTVIPMSIAVIHLLKRWNKPIGNEKLTQQMSSLVLGVYLIHPVFLDIILYTGYGPYAFNPFISIPATAMAVFALSLLTAWVAGRIPHIRKTV